MTSTDGYLGYLDGYLDGYLMVYDSSGDGGAAFAFGDPATAPNVAVVVPGVVVPGVVVPGMDNRLGNFRNPLEPALGCRRDRVPGPGERSDRHSSGPGHHPLPAPRLTSRPGPLGPGLHHRLDDDLPYLERRGLRPHPVQLIRTAWTPAPTAPGRASLAAVGAPARLRRPLVRPLAPLQHHQLAEGVSGHAEGT